ncbi:hypothetical protein QF046_001470 [Microbacterium sp. W4I4]|nr:hypothetical protein [Microbacterium sp. W4I4]
MSGIPVYGGRCAGRLTRRFAGRNSPSRRRGRGVLRPASEGWAWAAVPQAARSEAAISTSAAASAWSAATGLPEIAAVL